MKSDTPRDAKSPTAPHPILTRYYQHEGDRQPFVTALFDGTARHYDWVCAIGSLGSGQRYRRSALVRWGLRRGMKLLDVAAGTGLVAREAIPIVRDSGAVIGLDASASMLREARRTLALPLVQGTVERLPFGDDHFDFLTMAYALRHMADLRTAFDECRRVLTPGGRLLILEVSKPRSTLALWGVRIYMQKVVPLLARVCTGSAETATLVKYYWDTIAECLPPDTILAALRSSGFDDVARHVVGGLFSEYVGSKPMR